MAAATAAPSSSPSDAAAAGDGRPRSAASPWPNPPLERSVFGWDPLDEVTTVVADWLLDHAAGHDHLEVEAKVGTIISSASQQRIQLPVSTECVVRIQPGWRFESSMDASQHRRVNELLNKAVELGKGSVTYARRKEVDYFHDAEPPSGARSAGGGNKVRVTRDEATLQVKPGGVVSKRRLADLNVHCPSHAFDYRISINVEHPIDQVPTSEPRSHRSKNRLHYAHQRVAIDLTQVHLPADPHRPLHELEIELRDAQSLVREGLAARRQAREHQQQAQQQQQQGLTVGPSGAPPPLLPLAGAPSAGAGGPTRWDEYTPFLDTLQVFLNNVRMLIRNAPPPAAAAAAAS